MTNDAALKERQIHWQKWVDDHVADGVMDKAGKEYAWQEDRLALAATAMDRNSTVGSALDMAISAGRHHGYRAYADQRPPDTEAFQRLFAITMRGLLLTRVWWRHESIDENFGTDAEKSHMWLWSLATVSGAQKCSAWLGRWLYNMFEAGTIDSLPGDPEFTGFYRVLARAFEKRMWPTPDELPEGLGMYRPLFDHVDDPGAFAQAVMAHCDESIARGVGGRPETECGYIYEYTPWDLFAVDLWMFKTLREQISGHSVSLDVDHPWLTSPMSQLPNVTDDIDNDVTRRLCEAGKHWFGKDWDPWPEIPLYGSFEGEK
ncbi:hypothetical protein ACSFA7_27160 [Variovorax sp. LT1R20]|uniref:hypothetical protein n=1 Tax=Variovorax sp. LT1R20 TaxID=3443729 RepID=UPI003F489523